MWTCSSIIKVPVQTFGNLTKDWLFVNQFKTKKECDITYNLRHAIYVYELHCEQIPSLLSPNCPYKWDVQNPFSGRKRRRRWRRKNQCGESTTVLYALGMYEATISVDFLYQRNSRCFSGITFLTSCCSDLLACCSIKIIFTGLFYPYCAASFPKKCVWKEG